MTDLVERARALALAIDFSPDDLGGSIGTASLRNPDGKELLSIVEALSERIAVLESVSRVAFSPKAPTVRAVLGEWAYETALRPNASVVANLRYIRQSFAILSHSGAAMTDDPNNVRMCLTKPS
jgi:hypothetical protein